MLKSALQEKFRKQKILKPEKSRKTEEIAPDSDDEIPKLIPISKLMPFDQEILDLAAQFGVEPTNVQQAVEAAVKSTSENTKLKNKLFDNKEFPIYVQINCIKTFEHSRIIRIPLQHSVLTPSSWVCLIVMDMREIPNEKHNDHLEHYEKLFQQKGVTNIKKIITYHEFRTEYETIEKKRMLVELYDVFLADGRILDKITASCGNIFYNRRKIPAPVKLKSYKLKEHIDQTLLKTPLYVHSMRDSFGVQIGHSKMTTSELVENAFYVMKGLDKQFPGGFANVGSLNLFNYQGIVGPIHTTFKNQNDIILKKLPDNYVVNTESGELSTKMNPRVVKPTVLNETRGQKRTRTEEGKEEKDDEKEENEDDDDDDDATPLRINKIKQKSSARKVKKVQELAVVDENDVKPVNGESSKKKQKTDTEEDKKMKKNQEEHIANGNEMIGRKIRRRLSV